MNTVNLSVIIPTYNEAQRIQPTLALVRQYLDKRGQPYEVIVSDDGSRDDTVAVVQEISQDWPQCGVITSADGNRGKGYAVKHGILQSQGALVLFTDADNAIPIQELEKLEPYIHNYEVVAGSKYAPGAISHGENAKRVALSRLSNWLIRLVAVPGVDDTQCGFKLFQGESARSIFRRIITEGWGFDIEIFVVANFLRMRYKEVGVSWYSDGSSRVRPAHDAIKTLIELFAIVYRKQTNQYR